MPLVREGHICFSKLVTLRKGELAYDAIDQKLSPLDEETIKIAGSGELNHPWHCVYHQNKSCALYPLRPVQCAALFCEDTTELTRIYAHNRAKRHDILLHAPSHWLELAKAHEEECSISKLKTYATQFSQTASEIIHMVNYDIAFRELCTEKAQISPKLLNCVLGRPISQLLSGFGLALQIVDDTPHIICVGKSHYI